jgi:hypothetical protein
MAVSGARSDDADVSGGGGVTSVDALMIMQMDHHLHIALITLASKKIDVTKKFSINEYK